MDSTGIGWLFHTRLRVTEAGREIRLIVPDRGHIERLLSIVGAEEVFTVYRSLDKALERISSVETSSIVVGPHQSGMGPSDG